MLRWSRWGFLFVLAVFGFLGMSQPPKQPPQASDTCSVLAIGDTGSGMAGQKAIAQQLWAQAQVAPKAQMVLHLGDILYPDGNIALWGKSRYRTPYAPFFKAGIPIYPALGNHDLVLGFRPAILKYYGIPARYYTKTCGQTPEGKPVVQFFALDTNLEGKAAQAQWAWLASQLVNSKAIWRVVYGHHPIRSSGQHGDSASLQQQLAPILAKHHVHFYFSGHDHDYERFAPVGATTYVVSGGGGAVLRDFAKTPSMGSLVRVAHTHHALKGVATAEAFSLTAFDAAGKTIDQVVFHHL